MLEKQEEGGWFSNMENGQEAHLELRKIYWDADLRFLNFFIELIY